MGHIPENGGAGPDSPAVAAGRGARTIAQARLGRCPSPLAARFIPPFLAQVVLALQTPDSGPSGSPKHTSIAMRTKLFYFLPKKPCTVYFALETRPIHSVSLGRLTRPVIL